MDARSSPPSRPSTASLFSCWTLGVPVEPGRAVEVTVTMPVTAYTLRKGHSLLVLVASCNHPRYERNTHAGTPHWDEAKALPVKVTVYHDEEKPSRVILPVGE